MKETFQQPRRIVAIWLIAGLLLIYLQIIIGGITRLTGSGLSITEWEIVTGTLPPMTESSWLEEFEKYKTTPQFEKINSDMEMGGIFTPGTFKFIYFWEYLHRLWARMMGLIFIVPFLYFYFRKMIPGTLVRHLGFVIFFAALAATFGWIMVASGLVNRPWVNAYKLALHLCIGISVFIALWWAFIRYIHDRRPVKRWFGQPYIRWLILLTVLQIFLGGVMSGTKAALFVPTWPDYHGEMIPSIITSPSSWTYNNFNFYEDSPFLVSLIQFLHRNVAYVLLLVTLAIWYRAKFFLCKDRVGTSFTLFVGCLFIQAIIGILTLVKSIGVIPVTWGVLHQGMAVITLSTLVLHLFYAARANNIR